MNGFYVFTSNYLETLAERLAQAVREPLADPFSPEIIVVQSGGMQRWVSMELARHNGICANCRFPFPNRFLSDLLTRMDPDLPGKSPFDPDSLTFRIMQLLPECLENSEFQSLQAYLAADKNKLKLFQLSQKIADTFDQYLVFRPDMIFSWEAGRANHWQAVLWRKIGTGMKARHRAALRNDLIDWIRKQSPSVRNLPERISIFGISYLAPFHLQTFMEISRQIPVYLYLMNPCKEYWFGSDRSVQIHSCHSPMREVEVLYDHLLDMLASDPGLMPKDIVVMAPDIETYAPYIQAVFDVQDEIGVRIPFSIADQCLKKESRVIEALLSILDLKGSRFGAARILSLLEFSVVREKFGLSEADLEVVRHWIADTHIRWGRDAAERRKFGPEGFSENSWRQGLERLLLGYAMPGSERNMFDGILPYDPIEGEAGLLLGKFLTFIEQLFEHVEKLDKYYKLGCWNLLCNALLEKFIELSDTVERDIRILRELFAELTEIEELSGYQEAVALEVVRAMIERRLERENFGYGFISGGVTFCAMLPMRSIPFKVICLIGMNSDAFPRETRPLGFDLMAKHPRPGDRSRRTDDKYLFLEALISAREKLFISYIGQSLQDNTEMAPSVLVCELVDYIESGFGLAKERIVTRHPLQAFSPVYFDENSRFFSYSKENLLGAMRLVENTGAKQVPSACFSDGFSIPPSDMDQWKQIDLKDLCAFWANPARFMLQRRLGIYLTEEKSLPQERENFNVDPLERYLIGREMVAEKISDRNVNDLLPLFRAQGRLPVGTVGRVVYHQMECEVDGYINRSKPYTAEEALAPLEVNIDLDGFRLSGRLEGVRPSIGLVRFHYAKLQAKYLLDTWIQHLIHNLLDAERLSGRSYLVCKEAVWEFDPVSAGKQILATLIGFYWKGLSEPIHFFPESSFVYARQLLQKGNQQPAALNAAQQKWANSDFYRGESQDPYLDLLFRRCDPLDQQFQEMSLSVFNPIFQYARELQT